MSTVLVVSKGPLAGQRLELGSELVIGREGVAVTIEDSELSRRHAAVRPVMGGFEVEDLGSLNGTFVNGQRITVPTRIAGGDSIRVGQSVLELEATGARATAASAVPAPSVQAPAVTPTGSGVPDDAFGTHAAPEGMGRKRGIASRKLGPLLVSWAAVIATAVGLAVYFADHPR
ncbi:MAG: FHA domain-containing protein [Actinomycetota bacterium]